MLRGAALLGLASFGPLVGPAAGLQEDGESGGLLGSLFRPRADKSAPGAGAPANAPEDARMMTLHTTQGQSLSGRLTAMADGRMGFFSTDFQEVLPIDPDIVDSIRIPDPPAPAFDLKGKYQFWLRGGDVLQGRLLGFEPGGSFRIALDGAGEVTLEANLVERMEGLASELLTYSGPTGLDGWKLGGKCIATGPQGFWPQAAEPRAWLAKDLGLDRERIALVELKRKRGSHFRLYLLGKSEARSDKSAIVLEAWGDLLVAIEEGKQKHRTIFLPGAIGQDDTVRVQFRTTETSIEFLDTDGGILGSFDRPEGSGPALRLECDKGSVAIKTVQILDATSTLVPRRYRAEELLGYDGETNSFQSADGDVPAAAVLAIDFAEPDLSAKESPGFRVVYLGGRRMTGELLGLGPETISIQPVWLGEPLVCDLDGVVALTATGRPAFSRTGTGVSKSFLVTKNGEIGGELDSISNAGQISWNPSISKASATLNAVQVERIVINRKTAFFVSRRLFPHFLRLRSGDSFRCKVLEIGSASSRFITPMGGEIEVQNTGIKAIEFDTNSMESFAKLFEEKQQNPNQFGWSNNRGTEARRETSSGFDAASLERALALPRKYKGRGFDHLVLAKTGDFLRTNVVGWSPKGVLYSSGLADERLIPSNRIAAVVWLGEQSQGSEESLLGEEGALGARLVLDEQNIFKVELRGTDGRQLLAYSTVLGELAVDLSHINSIELSGELTVAPSIYSDWVLKPKQEPFPDGTEAAAASMPEVDKLAPVLVGKDLGGADFSLADSRGKVVVLDFWGFW